MSIAYSPIRGVASSESHGVLGTIGNTPLLRLASFEREFAGVEIYAKAEWFNPGGSVKDRPALRMILEAEESGALRPGKTILDATSGNTGIAYAMIGAARGYRVTLCLPANASPERKRILRAFGAEVIETPADEGSDGAIRAARELARRDPAKYFYADQYNNDANWRAHYLTTAEEIWRQTNGRITHFVAALGTSGTFMGTTRRLRELNPRIRCISLQPDSPFSGLEGWKHMETAIVPGIYDARLADDNLAVRTEEAYEAVMRLGHEEGILASPSAGGALAGCLRVARRLAAEKHVRGPAVLATIFPDSGVKYLSERFWQEAAHAEN